MRNTSHKIFRTVLRLLLTTSLFLSGGTVAFAAKDSKSATVGRYTLNLDGQGWKMWRDTAAEWKNDVLYLPEQAADINRLPVNPPTGGWQALDNASALDVSVPGTVEEYTTKSLKPVPEDGVGVSWWYRKITLPSSLKGRRILIHFESVRLRAEIYLDGQLVGYDMIGETPFDVDITKAVKPGAEQLLAVRVTNPGGNFHWQDFTPMTWGKYELLPSRAFGGIIGRVRIDAVQPVYVSDIYMQNQPQARTVKAIITVTNSGNKVAKGSIELVIGEKDGGKGNVIATRTLKQSSLKPGDNIVEATFTCPDAKLWDIASPNLYVCRAKLSTSKTKTDDAVQTFGFRWFAPEGIGSNARPVLNGRRMMLRTAISWGYWPVTGLIATPEMAVRQINEAKKLGLNMLNFHRQIGSPVVLEAADSIGLLYYEEPGGFHSAGRDSFARALANIKLERMIRRDRSHPSLVIYNLINEWGGPKSRDPWLTDRRMDDMRRAHAIDPSRIMTFTSGWAKSENDEEDAKANMRPFDTTLYRKGWFDNHRAGGPATWEEGYYRSPDDNIMFTDNRTEVFMRGEEGAISIPPRISLIEQQINKDGATGWDGLFWKNQYESFKQYFDRKNLKADFGTIDEWTRCMGDVQLDHQGRRIQSMRMQDIGDIYAVNGWEGMPYDNHSGIVDIYRNCKGHEDMFTRYTRPCYVAVAPRRQFAQLPDSVPVDIYLVNERVLKAGNYRLEVSSVSPGGSEDKVLSRTVNVKGGDRYGQLLHENLSIALAQQAGIHRIKARLLDASGHLCADGWDEVLALSFDGNSMQGRGALYSSSTDDPVAVYYRQRTGKSLKPFSKDMPALDWLVITRPSLDAPRAVPAEAFVSNGGKTAFQVRWFKDSDIGTLAGVGSDAKIDRSFVSGEQPDALVPANQPFSAIWTGRLKAPKQGTYLIGVKSDRGVRMSVDGNRVFDEWRNTKPVTITRPFKLEAGQEIEITVEYSQNATSGRVQLVWSLPGTSAVDPRQLLDRVKKDGTTLVLLDCSESWIDAVAAATGCIYNGVYTVGRNWVGGVHFAKHHPLLAGLPSGTALGWPWQAVVHDGDKRLGFLLDGDETVIGSYSSTPFHLGSALGVIPYGSGRIIYSTLDVSGNLLSSEPAAGVARRLFENIIKYANIERRKHQ